MNFVMREGKGLERERFTNYCKDEFHAGPDRLPQQDRDSKEGDGRPLRQGKHSRWGRDMQLRLGLNNIWELVSFIGRSDVALLQGQ